MSDMLSLRADPEIKEALSSLGDKYGNRTATLKAAILRLAEENRRELLRREVLEAAQDPEDVAEMRRVLAEMEELG